MFGKYALALAVTLGLAAAVGGRGTAAAAAHPHPAAAGVYARRAVSTPPQLGAAVNTVMLDAADPRYVRTLLAHYASVTPEYEMEMSQLEPAEGRFDFARADRIVAFAARHGLPVRGHTLVWDEMIPAWLTRSHPTRAQLIGILHHYIGTVVSHYRGRVGEWDVVNEPLTRDGSLRHSLWERVIGPGYIALAFRFAHRADPDAALFLNEYGAEWRDAKERALHRLVVRLRAEHVPVSGVGFQAHLRLDAHPPQAELTAVLRSFAALGVRLEVTELDVDAAGPAPLPQRLAAEAAIYRAVAGACRAVRACSRVTTWGITDAASWLGASERGLPFDAGYRAKPAWRALRAGLTPPA
jgi:endo-1,4-beta-xylanase